VHKESVDTYKKTMKMANLGGVFKLDGPEKAKANWARLFNTGLLLLAGGWLAKTGVENFYWKARLNASEKKRVRSEQKARSKF
jgi:hypothetical protein